MLDGVRNLWGCSHEFSSRLIKQTHLLQLFWYRKPAIISSKGTRALTSALRAHDRVMCAVVAWRTRCSGLCEVGKPNSWHFALLGDFYFQIQVPNTTFDRPTVYCRHKLARLWILPSYWCHRLRLCRPIRPWSHLEVTRLSPCLYCQELPVGFELFINTWSSKITFWRRTPEHLQDWSHKFAFGLKCLLYVAFVPRGVTLSYQRA